MKIKKRLLIIISSSLFLFVSLGVLGLFIFNGGLSFADGTDMSQKTLTVNGEQRIFCVHFPPDYKKELKPENKNTKFPVVLVFHGTVADANKIKNYTKFNDFADKNGIIAVYPEYTGNWDWDLRPPGKNKEVKFTSEIIDYMIKNCNADKKRIYQTGYSSGAEMSYILACSLPDKIAAFAPVSGNIRKPVAEGCLTNKPVPIMLVHGTADPYEKWDGNPAKEMLSVDETLNFFKKRNSCSGKIIKTVFPQKDPSNNSTIAELLIDNSGKNNAEVSILKIEGGGHTWPGSPTSSRIETFLGKTNYDINASDIIWDFFKRHKLN